MKIIYRDKDTKEELGSRGGWFFIKDEELWACDFGSGSSDDKSMWAGDAWFISNNFTIEVV